MIVDVHNYYRKPSTLTGHTKIKKQLLKYKLCTDIFIDSPYLCNSWIMRFVPIWSSSGIFDVRVAYYKMLLLGYEDY